MIGTISADRDRHYLAAEHVSLLEQHVDDLVAAEVDDYPLDLPDVAAGGMEMFAAAHSYLRKATGRPETTATTA